MPLPEAESIALRNDRDSGRFLYSFSDYNAAIPFDLPEATLQQENAGD